MIHCGSRGYGYQVADHFFHEGGKLRGLALNQREKSYLHVDEPLGKLYWQHHNAAANYAIANRHQIVHGITEATEEVLKHTPKVYYEISHNMVQHETLPLPDGTITKGFVHRKGSTRAMPSNHPDLVGTPWEHTGHPCCIPGSMFTGAAILFAGPNAHASACSVNHGSGRVLGRNEAKRQLTSIQELIDEQMNTVERDFNGTKIIGIVSNHKHTPIDECHECYKDLDEVLQILEQEQIAIVSKRLYPVANIKGK